MHRFLIKFLLVFVALGLPIQGVQAATMSMHAQGQAPSHATAAPAGHCAHAQHHDQDQQSKHSQPCGDASNCHPCCSPAMLPLAAKVNEPIGSHPQVALSASPFTSTFLEHPQRPPRPDSV